MARVDSLLNLRGRVKRMIFYNRNGKGYVKSGSTTFNDPRTEKQLRERSRFAIAVLFYQKLKPTGVRDVLRFSARGRASSGYALFMRLNLNVFKAKGGIGDFSRLRISEGERRGVFGLMGRLNESGSMTLRWEIEEADSFAGDSDRLVVMLIYACRSFIPVMVEGIETVRADGEVTFPLAPGADNGVHVYCCFAAGDKSGFSNTQYVYVG